MAKGGKKKGGNGGNDGGGSGGGDTPVSGNFVGTEGADRLRGGSGNETFHGRGGNDSINGGGGFDTAIYDGSALDFAWRSGWKGSYTVTDMNPADGDEGTDVLSGIEALQFSDYTIYIDGRDNDPVLTLDDSYQTRATDVLTISFDIYDFDASSIWITGIGSDQTLGLTTTYTDIPTASGDAKHVELTIDPTRYDGYIWLNDEHAKYIHLAEGELATETITLTLTGGSTHSFEINIAGVNDAPELSGATFTAFEDAAATFDLSGLGSDIDSDDDGTTLTYQIMGVPAGLDAQMAIDGSSLTFLPGDYFQMLNDGEVASVDLTLQAVDRHGAVSNLETVTVEIEGADDPVPNYLNADNSIDYAALGVDVASAPQLGRLSGLSGEQLNVDLTTFTSEDDIQVIKTDYIEWFGDYDFFYGSSGIDLYDDLTFATGAGNDRLIFMQDATEIAHTIGVDVATGDGEDVVVFDMTASGSEAGAAVFLEGVDVATGAHNDQILIDMNSDTSQIIEASDFSTGDGNDIVSVQLNKDDNASPGVASIIGTNFSLGRGEDQLVIDTNGQNITWGLLSVDLDAGAGNDYVLIDNSGTAASAGASGFFGAGLDGNFYMGDGDDILDLDVFALPASDNEALLSGGGGYDVLNLNYGTLDDYTIQAGAYGDSYTITTAGQTYIVSQFEEITIAGTDIHELF